MELFNIQTDFINKLTKLILKLETKEIFLKHFKGKEYSNGTKENIETLKNIRNSIRGIESIEQINELEKVVDNSGVYEFLETI